MKEFIHIEMEFLFHVEEGVWDGDEESESKMGIRVQEW